jgi:hypothetical protein
VSKDTYEWKNAWMHQEWQPMPEVHTEEAAVRFLEARLPHTEEGTVIRVNGGPSMNWTPAARNKVMHGVNCDCCPRW